MLWAESIDEGRGGAKQPTLGGGCRGFFGKSGGFSAEQKKFSIIGGYREFSWRMWFVFWHNGRKTFSFAEKKRKFSMIEEVLHRPPPPGRATPVFIIKIIVKNSRRGGGRLSPLLDTSLKLFDAVFNASYKPIIVLCFWVESVLSGRTTSRQCQTNY
jgi:hypothetical protein